ncbi:MAG: septum formation initiator family protein [Chitinophagaceae bacterium]|nr:septum formation initiator family protein [Chitinophagaceae bacterium]
MENNTENTTASSKPLTGRGFGRLAWLKNKYLIAGAFFLVWMLFFDPKDIGSAINRWRQYRELQASEQQLTKKIDDTKLELGQLKSNAQTIEKYAREKYLMKKDNEDLFIVNEAKKEK